MCVSMKTTPKKMQETHFVRHSRKRIPTTIFSSYFSRPLNIHIKGKKWGLRQQVSLDCFEEKKKAQKVKGASHRRHLSALCPSANSSSTQSIIIGPAFVSLPTIKTRTNTLESLSHINQSTVWRVLIFLRVVLFYLSDFSFFFSVASFIF